ncbi:MAG: hypothetical protein Q8O75_02675 [bacterium]|nr:hypothetical protein [bacterium]
MLKYFLPKAKSSIGFTLIELLIYAALLIIIGVVAVAFFIQVINVTETSRRSRESLDNARRVIDVIGQEIRHGSSVYTLTSKLDMDNGQLSLETTRDLPADEESTYVDMYLNSDGRVYLRRESGTDQLITSEKVKVTKLRFSLLSDPAVNDPAEKTAVQVIVTAQYLDPISGPSNQVTLTSTSTLRSYE